MNPVLYEIRPSQMLKDEVGLFALREMRFGSVIVQGTVFEETFEPWSTYRALDGKTRQKVEAFCVGTPTGFWMPRDFNLLPLSYFMNHSCDPNVGFDSKDNFIALRDIRAGDELCWDYGMGESNPKFRMECRCGSSSCRRIITGDDLQLPDLQRRYDGWFQWYLQEKINAQRGR